MYHDGIADMAGGGLEHRIALVRSSSTLVRCRKDPQLKHTCTVTFDRVIISIIPQSILWRGSKKKEQCL